ncbi:hypothetical protein GCM10020254_67320 [Streptomyces goshikiensis]
MLQGAAEPMWDGVGLRLFGSGYFNAPRLMCQERAGELLGAERYAACAGHGRALALDELVERALRGPEPKPVPPAPEAPYGGRARGGGVPGKQETRRLPRGGTGGLTSL